MNPTPSSTTVSTKPGAACVTRMPLAEAAATSTVLISTAQRKNTSSYGAASKVTAVPGLPR